VWLRLGYLEAAGWQPDHWLLYRQDTRRRKVELDEATETLTISGKQVGYADVTTRRHDQKHTGKIAHFWWYRCLERAGVVPKGTTAGTNMHRGRRTSATELQRCKHDLRLTQLLLGHLDIRSAARYAQMDTADLAEALSENVRDRRVSVHPETDIAGIMEAAGIEPAFHSLPMNCRSGPGSLLSCSAQEQTHCHQHASVH
jgi:hypothetical protein